jgi:peptide chain release factor 2|tara:strand:- start:3770 stop:4636 length:867 start_codon:yes stop_codon:yes gene_type:complete
LTEIIEIAIIENDNSLESEILESLQELTNWIDQLELKTLFDEEFDKRNVIVSIHAGAGGVESQDWAGMIMRMYLRWAEKNNMTAKVLETSKGDEAGIKSCTINIDGHNAFGMLRSEKGVHRLVRLSPYDSDNARHTSFVLVEILPEIESDIEIDIKSDDLNIESFKAGGAGGQSVQKNSTAIRITHIPTGIKVSCQNERSQVQNREIAMKILKSRLLSLEIKKRDENEKKLKGPHVSAEWGNQIRSYVLHPYKMVKDHRTNLESPDPDKILDGDLSEFIDKYLRMKKN